MKYTRTRTKIDTFSRSCLKLHKLKKKMWIKQGNKCDSVGCPVQPSLNKLLLDIKDNKADFKIPKMTDLDLNLFLIYFY